MIGTPRNVVIGGWCGGKPWRRGSVAMSAVRIGRFSRMISPRNPWPRGRSPIRARCSWVMPEVMNRSMTPSAPTIPSAAYCAPTSGRTWSTMTWRTSSTDLRPAIARVAMSKASMTPDAAGRSASSLTTATVADRVGRASDGLRAASAPADRAGWHGLDPVAAAVSLTQWTAPDPTCRPVGSCWRSIRPGHRAAPPRRRFAGPRAEGADLIVISVVEPHNLRLPGGLTRRVDQERDRLTAGAQAIVRQARDSRRPGDVPGLGRRCRPSRSSRRPSRNRPTSSCSARGRGRTCGG